ncbi:unnamed protein product [Fusarium venenatum]|uniref:Uncharacterized protein n=1 Tax=Fusarium venenatum TaxID=56646 RepID=A0A2L2T5G7_9HYPO|nr:uncharacterized protein FVRRES_01600 [Fusarium venenatum]CEI65088.1 unnamed protein product [Fusarium venenatum]
MAPYCEQVWLVTCNLLGFPDFELEAGWRSAFGNSYEIALHLYCNCSPAWTCRLCCASIICI